MRKLSWKQASVVLTIFGLMIGWQNLSATKKYHENSRKKLNRFLTTPVAKPSDSTSFSATAVSKKLKNTRIKIDSLVHYALGLKGTPYVYGGTSKAGFDCSGYTNFIFDRFGIAIPRSSLLQANAGTPIPRTEAQPGDLIIFTGTNSRIRKPGHVGIVISKPGEVITFVHSSSNGGVKTSQVEGTNYERRFLEIRRVL